MKRRLIQALLGKNKGRPPVWLMRQAGRFLPEYRAMRANHSLRDLFFTPEFAAKITLMPVERFGVDAAILFSDITAIAPALGLDLSFREGPTLSQWVEPDRLCELRADLSSLKPIFETVSRIKQETTTPLIGFCGGPFTVASYFVQPDTIGEWISRQPEKLTEFLDRICDITIEYIKGQIAFGADAIQIFDSWANLLQGEDFERYSLRYFRRLAAAVDVPTIAFMRGSAMKAEALEQTGVTAVSVDWDLPLRSIRAKISCAIQGNLDPDLLFQPLDVIRATVRQLLDEMRGDQKFIVNLGHGVKVGTPVEAVAALVEEVQCSS